jgi:hypothetical protein
MPTISADLVRSCSPPNPRFKIFFSTRLLLSIWGIAKQPKAEGSKSFAPKTDRRHKSISYLFTVVVCPRFSWDVS